jgi:hypothetical protein
MNVLDFEEDGAFVILASQSHHHLVAKMVVDEEAELPPDKASAILRRELVAFELVPSPLVLQEDGVVNRGTWTPPDKAFDILSRELVPPFGFEA